MILFGLSAHAWRAKESEKYMKKISQTDKDELRPAYKPSDFPGGVVRGKYASRIRESSNIVVLKPEVAEVFPNEEAVNSALLSLIELAQKTTRPKKVLKRTQKRTECCLTRRVWGHTHLNGTHSRKLPLLSFLQSLSGNPVGVGAGRIVTGYVVRFPQGRIRQAGRARIEVYPIV
jgi:hypothetical protein